MRAIAIAAARAAGEIQKKHYGRLLQVDAAKRHDIKLEVDRLCEETVARIIHDKHPDHAILGEEGGLQAGAGEYRWIVDPLDGTVNFFYGLPCFCVSVACYRAPFDDASGYDTFGADRGKEVLGEPVVGVIYAPRLDEFFVAESGKGALLNDQPLRAAEVTRLEDAIATIGFGSIDENIEHMRRVNARLVGAMRKVRCLGAAAYDLANIAAGRTGIHYERGIRSWDIAAGRVLVEEAGGHFEAYEYAPQTWDVLACAPGLVDAARALIWP